MEHVMECGEFAVELCVSSTTIVCLLRWLTAS